MTTNTDKKTPVQSGQSSPYREAIKNSVLKMGSEFSPEDKKEHAKVLIKIIEKDMSPKEAMNISDEEISVIYSYAYQLFNSGKYEEACELFKMLLVLDAQEGGFASAVGSCYHKLKDYETALHMFLIHSQLSPFDPAPLMYCYDCFLRLDNADGAYLMLVAAINRAKENPTKYAKLQEKAQILLNNFDASQIKEIYFPPDEEIKIKSKDRD